MTHKEELLERLRQIKDKIESYEARKIAYQLQGDVDNAHLMVKSIRLAKKMFNQVDSEYKKLK